LLQPDFAHGEDFFSGELAVIDQAKCLACGQCEDACKYAAIEMKDGFCVIDEISCEGCGYCARVCPEAAIDNIQQNVGQTYRSSIRTGTTMIHAQLRIGADNSGKLVTRVKKTANEVAQETGQEWILVDGPPGIGCPVISSLSGSSLVVMVTEPTVSGLHDLKRAHRLVKRFGIRSACVINKSDLSTGVRKATRLFLKNEEIPILAEIPYTEKFTAAMTQGKTIVEWDASLERLVRGCWEKIILMADKS
jgi:MinD superfamily P-loop ATPase